MTKCEFIEGLKKMDGDILIGYYNDMCENENRYDDHLYSMYEFNEVLETSNNSCNLEPIDLAIKVAFGSFNPYHDYFGFNGYGNLVSYDSSLVRLWFDYDELATYMIDNEIEYEVEG